MKQKSFIHSALIIALTFVLASCSLGGDSNYTPRLLLLNPAKISTDSTLSLSYTKEGNIKFDSLHVRDTVTVFLHGDGFVNSLQKLDITVTEEGDITVLAPHDSITRQYDPSSDFIGGKIIFPKNIGGMVYPFKFVAAKPTSKTKINFVLTSDAKEISNISSLQLEFPIKPLR